MDSIFQSLLATQKLKELDSNKIDFACIYNDVSSGFRTLGAVFACSSKIQIMFYRVRLVLYAVNLKFFQYFSSELPRAKFKLWHMEDSANIFVFQVIALTET